MIASSVLSSRDLWRSESVRPVKLNTRSVVTLSGGIVRNLTREENELVLVFDVDTTINNCQTG